jgi:hypothetical protein
MLVEQITSVCPVNTSGSVTLFLLIISLLYSQKTPAGQGWCLCIVGFCFSSSLAWSADLRMLPSGNSRHLFIRVTVHQPRSLSGPEDIYGRNKRRLRQDAEAWAVSADQFILLNDKIQGINQRDTGINMLLNDLFITERRIAKREAIVVFQQAGQQGLPDTWETDVTMPPALKGMIWFA